MGYWLIIVVLLGGEPEVVTGTFEDLESCARAAELVQELIPEGDVRALCAPQRGS